MYYEDTDLCFEARERGLRVLYEPAAVVVHVEGATAGNDIELRLQALSGGEPLEVRGQVASSPGVGAAALRADEPAAGRQPASRSAMC